MTCTKPRCIRGSHIGEKSVCVSWPRDREDSHVVTLRKFYSFYSV